MSALNHFLLSNLVCNFEFRFRVLVINASLINQRFLPNQSSKPMFGQDVDPLEGVAPLATIEEKEGEGVQLPSLTLQLLTNGYIRIIIQPLLCKDNIIPQEIYHLCLLFFRLKSPNILWTMNKSQYDHHQAMKHPFGIIDIYNKQSINIKLKNFRILTIRIDLIHYVIFLTYQKKY